MKRIISGLLSLTMAAGLMLAPVSARDFADIQGHWGQSAIQHITDLGFFAGTGENTFSPDEPMTRGMFVTVLAQAARWMGLSVETEETAVFTDVESDAYYAPYVAWASTNGIVAGMGDGRFAPESPITRQDMCVILRQFLVGYAGYALEAGAAATVFLDQEEISDYAREAVSVCCGAGLISGVPAENGVLFQPAGQASRAMVAVVMNQVAEQAESWDKTNGEESPGGEVPDSGESQQPSGGGASPETPETPAEEEPSEEERAQEAAVAGYLETMLDNYYNSSYLKTTDQAVQDCMAMLMDCIEDALERRAEGQFLYKEFIQSTYSDQIDAVGEAYHALTEEQLSQINNVIVRLEDSDHIYEVMDYFGVDYMG